MGSSEKNMVHNRNGVNEGLSIVWEGDKLGMKTDAGFQTHSTEFGVPVRG